MPIFASAIADTNRFTQARDEAQNLLQWLARMALSFAPTQDGSRAPLLAWDPQSRMMSTGAIAADTVLQLRLTDLQLHFAEHGAPVPHAIDVDGKSSAEIEAWLLVEMLHRGFDRERFRKDLPYRWPKLMSGDEIKYESESHGLELTTLVDFFEQASTILLAARARFGRSTDHAGQASKNGMSCEPESFAIGFDVPRSPGAPEDEIYIGFTAGDHRDPAPRFFVRHGAVTEPSRSSNIVTITVDAIRDADLSSDAVVDALVAAATTM